MAKMQKKRPLPLLHPAFWIGTVFGIGRIPLAPGTWGSLAALPVAWVVVGRFGPDEGPLALVLLAALFFPIGLWASHVYGQASESHDPPDIVIDEVVAQWLVLALVPQDGFFYGLAFFFFRVADILKPWPIRRFEKRFPGAFGVMADDLLAALYAAAGLFIAMYFLGA